MKHLKLFEEININGSDFPSYGHELSQRESKILKDLVANYLDLDRFVIKVDDHSYYVNYGIFYNLLYDFNELKDYVLSHYYMDYDKPEDFLKLLKTSKLNPSFDNNVPIRWACDYGHVEIVKHLLDDPRVDPCVGNNSPIQSACLNGRTEIVRLLLNDPRVDPSADNNSPIRDASYNGHTEIVKLLLNDPRVDPSVNENSPIFSASYNGNIGVVKLLLNDERVRDKLTDSEINRYTNEIS